MRTAISKTRGSLPSLPRSSARPSTLEFSFSPSMAFPRFCTGLERSITARACFSSAIMSLYKRTYVSAEGLAYCQADGRAISFSDSVLWPSSMLSRGMNRFVAERSPEWMRLLRELFAITPSAAVGEIGLDKGSHGRNIEFSQQVEVFRQQLELAKELERPVSIHCVRAFGDLLEIMQCIGPFPAGVILHSFMGSAEMVPAFTQLGSYFSLSGFLTSMKTEKAKKMLKSVPIERILFESDAPDAFPKSHIDSLSLLVDNSIALGHQSPEALATSAPNYPKEELNHPANIQIVLNYVAKMLDVSKERLAEASYQNAIHLFSYPGSKLHAET